MKDGYTPAGLKLPEGIIDMVLDTDTYNEVDDQFALCYALLSPERLNVQAVYAAPFFNNRSTGPEDGMVKSYNEIVRLLRIMHVEPEGFALEGSRRYFTSMDDHVDSPAARDLVARAMARPEGAEKLLVVAIGAITNVASALRMEPRIAEKIHILWLAGQPLHAPSAAEFNLSGDLLASRAIFESSVPLTLVPCTGVASHLLTSVPEMKACIGGKNELCDTLISIFASYSDDHFAWAKEIWDVSTIARLLDPDWAPAVCVPRPHLSSDAHWCPDDSRAPMQVVTEMHRNPIFRDLFTKLAAFNG